MNEENLCTFTGCEHNQYGYCLLDDCVAGNLDLDKWYKEEKEMMSEKEVYVKKHPLFIEEDGPTNWQKEEFKRGARG